MTTTPPTTDLYAILGLEKGAPEEAIKAAYKEAVKTAHPDVGGDTDAFHRLVFAKLVLLDPKAREAYDLHGIVPKDLADNATAAVLTTLTGIFGHVLYEILQAKKDPVSGDLVAAMQNAFTNNTEAANKQITQLEFNRALLERMLGRFKVKNLEHPNFMEIIVQGQVDQLTKQIGAAQASIKSMAAGRDYLSGITFLPAQPSR